MDDVRRRIYRKMKLVPTNMETTLNLDIIDTIGIPTYTYVRANLRQPTVAIILKGKVIPPTKWTTHHLKSIKE